MMNYTLNMGCWNSVFAVPTTLVDKHMKLASESAIKLILFLLRHSDKIFTKEELQRELGIRNGEKIDEAIEFWSQRGLLKQENGVLLPNEEVSPAKTLELAKETTPEMDTKFDSVTKVELSRPPRFSPSEIAEKIRNSKQVSFLFKHVEGLYSRPLKHSEQQMLMAVVDYAGLSVDVVIMLMEFCFSIGKTSPHYIQATAIKWAEEEINTHEKAEEHIKKLKDYYSGENEIKKMMEFNSSFSKKQKDYINAWLHQLKMPMEMINLAYQATLDGTGKLNFPYMNKVLENWSSKGISTPQQVEEERKAFSKKNETVSSFTTDDLESKALEKYRRS